MYSHKHGAWKSAGFCRADPPSTLRRRTPVFSTFTCCSAPYTSFWVFIQTQIQVPWILEAWVKARLVPGLQKLWAVTHVVVAAFKPGRGPSSSKACPHTCRGACVARCLPATPYTVYPGPLCSSSRRIPASLSRRVACPPLAFSHYASRVSLTQHRRLRFHQNPEAARAAFTRVLRHPGGRVLQDRAGWLASDVTRRWLTSDADHEPPASG